MLKWMYVLRMGSLANEWQRAWIFSKSQSAIVNLFNLGMQPICNNRCTFKLTLFTVYSRLGTMTLTTWNRLPHILCAHSAPTNLCLRLRSPHPTTSPVTSNTKQRDNAKAIIWRRPLEVKYFPIGIHYLRISRRGGSIADKMPPPNKQHSTNKEIATTAASTQCESSAPSSTTDIERYKKLGPGRLTVHRVPPPGCSGEEPDSPRDTGAKVAYKEPRWLLRKWVI
jgi:hypothetical protein